MRSPIPVVLAGYGSVGRAFVSLLCEKSETLRSRYGLDLWLRAILKSDGGFISDSRNELESFRGRLGRGPAGARLWRPGLTLKLLLPTAKPGVLVECTSSDIRTGEPGLGHIRSALKAGWHVVTASKGPLVVDLNGLRQLARKKHLSLKYGAATAAALPTLDVGVYSLAGAEILSVEGILNGTTNYILTRMQHGAGYEEALREAREKGIAERNPTLDVEGWDTAVKLLLIANSVLGLNLTLRDIQVEGITRLPTRKAVAAREEGKALKLIGRISKSGLRYKAEVAPSILDRSHPLFGVDGASKGITFATDTMGTVTVTGGKSDPRGAAAALLKDIINIFAVSSN
jgi:homoserine dehydrogenase